MTFIAILEIVSGLGVVGLWTLLLLIHQVPEIRAGDRAIWFHVFAEYLLGGLLVTAGLLLLLQGAATSTRVLAAAGGMVYSTINSPGYYARQGKWGAVAAFAAPTLIGVIAVVHLT